MTAAATPNQPGDGELDRRVEALIAQMTLAEKAGQVTQYFYFDPFHHRGVTSRSAHRS